MLSQMPTSALSFLSSSSKGLDGFFGLISVGIQTALTVVLAEFNIEFTTAVRATATVKLALQPTKCVLSNGTGFHPYVAAMGSATIVLLIVSYVLLRTKGRDPGEGEPLSPPSAKKSDPVSGGQPPSPPEDPETESGAKKRRNRWPFHLLIMLGSLVLLSLGAAFVTVYLIRSRRLVDPIAHGLLVIERGLSSVWNITADTIFLHRRPLLFALGSHLVFIFIRLALPQAWRHLSFLRSGPLISLVYIPVVVVVASPRFRWIFWMMYYFTGFYSAHAIWAWIYQTRWSFVLFIRPYGSDIINSHFNHGGGELELAIMGCAVLAAKTAYHRACGDILCVPRYHSLDSQILASVLESWTLASRVVPKDEECVHL
ncbi:hypothetical protein C8R46DRAFT_1192448 [Mycena filopes]|nr:hypothetical protein C8R46DRAFT_1192448 [Mycena filopes]